MFLSSKTFVPWALLVGSCYGFFHFDINQLLNSHRPVNGYDEHLPDSLWITQPLDHSRPNNGTWKMRYFENLKYFRPGGPIILFIGGESAADPRWIVVEEFPAVVLAKELGGALLMSEHRFYGESVPNNDFSVQNLQYLTTQQASWDIAVLIDNFKSQTKFKDSKVVLVGGSYAGNLAAWLADGNKVNAVWSSSAPVLAVTDFYEYYEVVGEVLKKFGTPDCYDNVAKKFQRYVELLKTAQGTETLKKEANICESVDMTVRANQQFFFMGASENYAYLVQYGYPASIRDYCSKMKFDLKYINAARDHKPLTWNYASSCYDYDYNHLITGLKTYPEHTSWIYQICTQFGYLQSLSSAKQPFTQSLTADFFFNLCTDLFGPDFGQLRMELGVNLTNSYYGGLHPRSKYTVFINGDMDPWHKLGVLEDLTSVALARVVANSSHCSELVARPGTESVVKFAKDTIKHWLASS